MYHNIGDWMPDCEKGARFSQIFTLDTEEEQLACRIGHMPYLDKDLLQELQV